MAYMIHPGTCHECSELATTHLVEILAGERRVRRYCDRHASDHGVGASRLGLLLRCCREPGLLAVKGLTVEQLKHELAELIQAQPATDPARRQRLLAALRDATTLDQMRLAVEREMIRYHKPRRGSG